jgi:hypothetical protein
MKELEKSAQLIKTLRGELGSISLEDIAKKDEPQLTDIELNARAGDAEIFYKNYFKKVIDFMIYEQQILISDKVQDQYQLAMGRGTINGLYLIKEWFEEQVGLSMSRFQKEEKGEPGEIV